MSRDFGRWTSTHGVELHFSRPSKPTGNAFVEAFNTRFGQGHLNQHYWFPHMDEAWATIESWRHMDESGFITLFL